MWRQRGWPRWNCCRSTLSLAKGHLRHRLLGRHDKVGGAESGAIGPASVTPAAKQDVPPTVSQPDPSVAEAHPAPVASYQMLQATDVEMIVEEGSVAPAPSAPPASDLTDGIMVDATDDADYTSNIFKTHRPLREESQEMPPAPGDVGSSGDIVPAATGPQVAEGSVTESWEMVPDVLTSKKEDSHSSASPVHGMAQPVGGASPSAAESSPKASVGGESVPASGDSVPAAGSPAAEGVTVDPDAMFPEDEALTELDRIARQSVSPSIVTVPLASVGAGTEATFVTKAPEPQLSAYNVVGPTLVPPKTEVGAGASGAAVGLAPPPRPPRP